MAEEAFEYIDGYRSSCKYHSHGNVNIILSAPHGGTRMPDDVPDRIEGTWAAASNTICSSADRRRSRISVVRDSRTDEFTANVAEELKNRWNLKPFMVIGTWHRAKVDFNRDLYEGTLNQPEAISAYESYHGHLDDAIRQVNQLFGKGLLIDIHGHSRGNYTMLGYLLSSAQLDADDLSDPSFQTSIESLCSSNRNECIRGENSFGSILERHGLGVAYPSFENPKPGSRTFFSGGHIVHHYASKINAIQTELPTSLRMAVDQSSSAQQFAESVLEFMKTHHLLMSK